MDAATTRFSSKYALLIAALMAAPVAAQAQAVLQVGTNSVTVGAQAQNVTVSSSGGVTTPLSFSITPSYGNGVTGWFNVAASGTITQTSASGSPTTLTIGLSYAQAGTTTQGTIKLSDLTNTSDPGQTITVTYTPGGGTGGTGTLTVSQSSVSMSTSPNNSVQVTQTISISTTSSVGISGTITLNNNNAGSYLQLSTGSFSVASGSQAQFTLIGEAFTPAGSYSATILITPSSGQSVQIPVTYTSATGTFASPSSVTLSYPGGPTSANSTVTTSSGDSFYATASSNPSGWLLVQGTSGTTSYEPSGTTIVVSVNGSVAEGLTTGTYSGQVLITSLDGTQTTINVTLGVNGASSGVVTLSQSSLTISVPAGTTNTQPSTIELTTGTANVSYTASVNQTWLSLSQYSGSLSVGTNNPLTIYAYPGGLSTGTYYGTVTLSYSGGYTGSSQIPVTLEVGTSTGQTGGLVAPTSLSFYYQTGGYTQSESSAVLVNTTGTWTATVSSGSTWLSAAGSGAGSTPISVSVSPSGLAAGTYTGTIAITTTTNGSTSVPVTLTVTTGMVATTAPGAYLVPTYTVGSVNPQTDVEVYASDNSNQAVTATASASWITVTSNANPTTVATFLLTLNPAGLPNGLNSGTVTFTVANATDSSLVLPVAIIVSGSTSTTGPLTFSASSLAFNATVGGTAPSQTLVVSSTSASTFSVTPSASWLSVTPTSGSLPATLTVSVNTAGLTSGQSGYLTFLANGVTQTFPVSLGIGTTGTSGLTATPSSLSFTYSLASTPASQTISVQSTNGQATAFTASASTSTGGSWLSLNVSPTQTLTTPSNNFLTASINTSGLTAAGTYSGTITLTTTSGTLSIPVTLTISGAPPITVSPTSLTFSYAAGGSAPNSQSVSVSGSGNFSATATSTGNWLSVTPSTGTAPTTLTVSVNPAGLTPGSYSGSIAVAATGGATGSATITVSLTVTAPLPTISQVSNAASYVSEAISPGELITIFGTAIGPTTPVQLTLTSSGTVSTNIGNVEVLVNGIACPLIYVSSTQVSAVVPYAVAIFQTAQVYVEYLGQSSNAMEETVATTAPGLFTANSSGTGPGAILNQNLSVNSPSNPAAPGSVVTLYLTGEGQTSPPGVTGSVTQALAAPPYTPSPLLPVAALVNNSPATIEFAGEAPGIVAGVLQVNVLIPAGTPAGAIPVAVSIGGRSTQNGVTVSVQ
jgi:uncharacterized protein (TIGR03437 family)